jgi:hypothetical protein
LGAELSAKLPANLQAKFLTAIKNLAAMLSMLTILTMLTVFKTDRSFRALCSKLNPINLAREKSD